MSSGNSANFLLHQLLRARDWQHRPQFNEVCGWWRGGGQGVCSLIGIGGAGKTAIADRFLQVLPGVLPLDPQTPKDETLTTPTAAFVFSFYDAPNPEAFFDDLVAWLRANADTRIVMQVSPSGRVSYHQMVQWLQNAPPGLLILDGLEKIQEDGTRGGIFGRIADGNLRDFLSRLSQGYLPHLSALITSRFTLADLDEASPTYYRPIDVEEIDLQTGIDLLRRRGVTGNDAQLAAIVENCGRHALTVDMAGGLLCEFHKGDPTTNLAIGTREEIEQAAAKEHDPRRRAVLKQELRFAKVAGRYRQALQKRDKAALALLERVCLFRLGVDAETLAAIFTGKGSQKAAGTALSKLNKKRLQEKLDLLVRMGLLEASVGPVPTGRNIETNNRPVGTGPTHTLYTIHPAIRDGFLSGLAADTRQHGHEAAREGLTAALGESPGENPSDPATLDLLEEIVHHTLQSGHVQEAWDIYWNRIGGYRNLLWRLGAYERGERICRAFAGGQSPDELFRSGGFQPPSERNAVQTTAAGSHRYEELPEDDQAIFINEWALYLEKLGRLAPAARCFELYIESSLRQENWRNASIGNQNLCEVWLLSGRLSRSLPLGAEPAGADHVRLGESSDGALATADELLRLAELADDANARREAHYCHGAVRAFAGEIATALADLHASLEWRHKVFPSYSEKTHWGLRGVRYAQVLQYLGRINSAVRSIQENLETCQEFWGQGDNFTPRFQLVLSSLSVERSGSTSSAAASSAAASSADLWTSARDWALARDAKEVLCWSDLVRAELELAKIKRIRTEGNEGSKEENSFASLASFCSNTLGEGLKIARDCGYGIFHIDLLLARARLHLLDGNATEALDDVRLALDEGVPANEEIGQPELLAARHEACGYAWAIPFGLQLRAEALLLQAAQQLGRDSFVPAKINNVPAPVLTLIDQAKQHLQEALALWQPLHDPEPERPDQNFQLDGQDYNYRAAETWQILQDLEGGVLTNYPLEPVRHELDAESSPSQSEELPAATTEPPASPPANPSPPQPPLTAATAIWQEKLDYLRQQEAITADPTQKFALKKQIDEAQRRIAELGGSP